MKINRTLNIGLLALALAGCCLTLHLPAAEPTKAGVEKSPYNYRDTAAYKALVCKGIWISGHNLFEK